MNKITILCLGTRGDVQPYVALALALQRKGFTPKIAAPLNFASFIREYEIPYSPINMNTEEGLRSPEGRAWLASGNTRAFIRHLNVLMKRDRPFLQEGCWAACQGADAIIGTMMTLGEGRSLSERLRLPFIASLTFPLLPRSRYFANCLVAPKDLPTGWLNYLTHVLFERVSSSGMRADLNRWRAQMDLIPLNTSPSQWLQQNRILTLHHYGEPLFHGPTDWKPHNVLTGPLFLTGASCAASPPDPKLADFLAAGESPVFLGFGSMPILDPEAVLRMTARVTERLGVRAVIGAGWSQLRASDLPKHLTLVESADHNQLFARCQALVHHGGAGTTFTGLRCGKPAVVFSVFADQPFWGERLKKAGVGVHCRFSAFSEDTLFAGLRHVLQPATKQQAQHLGKQLQAADGAADSVAEISRYLRTTPRPALTRMGTSHGV